MIPPSVYMRNLELVARFRNVAGSVVECGVWKGGMMAGIANVLGPDRVYYLFDSFEGLPDPQAIDGPAALRWKSTEDSEWFFDNCAADIRFAQAAMEMSPASRFELIRGFFNNTMPGFQPEQPIAILRLDADWYDSTITCLEHLASKVVPGGVIIVDDYYAWDGCARAVHDFLARTSAVERIQQFRDSVCYLVKGPVA
jgi:O-methyltransferase